MPCVTLCPPKTVKIPTFKGLKDAKNKLFYKRFIVSKRGHETMNHIACYCGSGKEGSDQEKAYEPTCDLNIWLLVCKILLKMINGFFESLSISIFFTL